MPEDNDDVQVIRFEDMFKEQEEKSVEETTQQELLNSLKGKGDKDPLFLDVEEEEVIKKEETYEELPKEGLPADELQYIF